MGCCTTANTGGNKKHDIHLKRPTGPASFPKAADVDPSNIQLAANR